MEARAGGPAHARVGPQETFLAVRIAVAQSVYRHRDRLQAGDELHQVHIMAADVAEGVGIFAGAPVLKIRVPIIPLLMQARVAEPEFAEFSFPIRSPGHQAAIVETLVIIDPYE